MPVLLASGFLLLVFPKEKPFEITFLDVGQGDGIYLSAGDGVAFFIDGGSSDVNEVGEYRILPFLKSKGVARIDYWFVTHCDTDHVSGLIDALEEGYEIGYIVLARHVPKDAAYEKLMQTAKYAGVPVVYMEVGDSVSTKQMTFLCMGPSEDMEVAKDRNDCSMILKMEWKSVLGDKRYTAFFAGDISTEVEKTLIVKEKPGDVDLYKAIHHGSNYSNSEEILDALRPETIVISCAKKNRYGHPGKDAVVRMEETDANLYYTMDVGQVTIEIDKKGLVSVGVFLLQ